MQVRKDAVAAARLLADDYVFLQADGVVSNKAQNIAVLRDPAFVCQSLITEDVKVRVYGEAAVVTGRVVMRATYGGQDVGGEFLYTDVWARRDGRWADRGVPGDASAARSVSAVEHLSGSCAPRS